MSRTAQRIPLGRWQNNQMLRRVEVAIAGAVDRAAVELDHHWFAYPKDVLRECRPFVPEETTKRPARKVQKGGKG